MESFSGCGSFFGLTSAVEHGGIFTADLTAGWDGVKRYFSLERELYFCSLDH